MVLKACVLDSLFLFLRFPLPCFRTPPLASGAAALLPAALTLQFRFLTCVLGQWDRWQ